MFMKNKYLSIKTKSSRKKKLLFFMTIVSFLLIAYILFSTITGDIMDDKSIVVLETNKGIIKIELDKINAPISSENFINYVNDGFFDGLLFHRVIPDFMIQGGGFYPNGSQKKTLTPIKLESDNGLKNQRGTIAMARTNDPNSATSQFFINLKDNDFLNKAPGNPGYAVFGEVIEGMDVVDSIATQKTSNKGGHQDWPKDNILILKASLL
jgi:peptidyl-prolyl cis-trans isomerase B (cyclophilin B)